MEETIKKILDMLVDGGMKVLIALIVIGVGFWLSSFVVNLTKKSRGYKKLDPSVQSFLCSFISIAGKVLTILISAAVVGIPTTSLITVLGSIGVAIGLALQGGLSNIAGGLMILLFRPFSVGDHISDGVTEGVVNAINLFYTELITFDNEKISLPNGVLSNSTIKNFTALPERRVRIDLPVSHTNDTEKVKKLINEIIENEPLILKDKESLVQVNTVVDGTVNYLIKVWSKTNDYWTVYFNLMNAIRNSFEKNKIQVPYVAIKYTEKK